MRRRSVEEEAIRRQEAEEFRLAHRGAGKNSEFYRRLAESAPDSPPEHPPRGRGRVTGSLAYDKAASVRRSGEFGRGLMAATRFEEVINHDAVALPPPVNPVDLAGKVCVITDTNVVLRSVARRVDPPSAQIARLVSDEQILLCATPATINELNAIMGRMQASDRPVAVTNRRVSPESFPAIAGLMRQAFTLEWAPEIPTPRLEDWQDQKFLNALNRVPKTALMRTLVTYDRHLLILQGGLPEDEREILKPAEFLKRLVGMGLLSREEWGG